MTCESLAHVHVWIVLIVLFAGHWILECPNYPDLQLGQYAKT